MSDGSALPALALALAYRHQAALLCLSWQGSRKASCTSPSIPESEVDGGLQDAYGQVCDRYMFYK